MKIRFAALAAAGALALSACSTSNPLGSPSAAPSAPSGSSASGALVVGSQQYYSNEIIAELYAQALEAKGVKVTRQYQIGQREVYLPELQSGKIDVFPEYAGNLLQYLDKNSTAKTTDQIVAALPGALGGSLRPLEASKATDQDSYNVTAEFAQANGLTSIADLAKLNRTIKVCANSELEKRPYGPPGLKTAYNLDVEVVPVEDSGGPLTVKALKDGKCDTADIYSADPSIGKNSLTTLTDPQNLILPQNVVPIVSQKVDQTAADVINKVSQALTTEELVALNTLSVDKQQQSAAIAKEWLTKKGLLS